MHLGAHISTLSFPYALTMHSHLLSPEGPKQEEKSKRSTSIWDGCKEVIDMVSAPPSTAAPVDHVDQESCIASSDSLSQEMNIEDSVYQNTLLSCDYQHQNGKLYTDVWIFVPSQANFKQFNVFQVQAAKIPCCQVTA